jgi:hypothetical protein
LTDILRRSPLLMEGLRAARDVDAPDWLLAAGAVWDDLHGRPLSTPPRDVGLPWDARNEAAVHLCRAEKRWGERWPRLRFS